MIGYSVKSCHVDFDWQHKVMLFLGILLFGKGKESGRQW